jgi:hypothetical protein
MNIHHWTFKSRLLLWRMGLHKQLLITCSCLTRCLNLNRFFFFFFLPFSEQKKGKKQKVRKSWPWDLVLGPGYCNTHQYTLVTRKQLCLPKWIRKLQFSKEPCDTEVTTVCEHASNLRRVLPFPCHSHLIFCTYYEETGLLCIELLSQ